MGEEMGMIPMSRNIWRRGNVVYFYDECDPESIFKLKEHLMNIYQERTSMMVAIVINSPGGTADSIAIYDWLKTYPLPIVTFVEGVCYSAAGAIFIAGKQRWMSMSSLYMIHSAHGLGGDDLNAGTAGDTHEMLKSYNAVSSKMYLNETKLTKAQLDDMMGYKDKALSVKECVKYGIAHKIGCYMEGMA